MSELAFFGAFALTVVLLFAAALTGRRARRRAHVSLVVAAVIALGITIVLALRLGRLYDLESAGVITPIHLTIARIATGVLVVQIVGGIVTARMRDRDRYQRWRRLHRWGARFAIGITMVATVTGVAMLSMAEKL